MNTYKVEDNETQNQSFGDIYGGRRGYVIKRYQQLLYLAGRCKQYEKINWKRIDRLVIVCAGNICRSPYAETLANKLGVEAISCGIDTMNGLPACPDAIEIASERGVDLTGHKAKKMSAISIKSSDLFVTMEYDHAKYLKMMLGNDYEITMLGLWGNPVSPYINDPYQKSHAYIRNCFDYIERSLTNLVSKLPERIISYSGKE